MPQASLAVSRLNSMFTDLSSGSPLSYFDVTAFDVTGNSQKNDLSPSYS